MQLPFSSAELISPYTHRIKNQQTALRFCEFLPFTAELVANFPCSWTRSNLDKSPSHSPTHSCCEWQAKSQVQITSDFPQTARTQWHNAHYWAALCARATNFTFKMQSGRRGKFTAPFVVHMKIRECVSWGVGALGLMGPSAIENAGDASRYRCLFEHLCARAAVSWVMPGRLSLDSSLREMNEIRLIQGCALFKTPCATYTIRCLAAAALRQWATLVVYTNTSSLSLRRIYNTFHFTPLSWRRNQRSELVGRKFPFYGHSPHRRLEL